MKTTNMPKYFPILNMRRIRYLRILCLLLCLTMCLTSGSANTYVCVYCEAGTFCYQDKLTSCPSGLTKTQAHALVCACWYMAPEELGGEVVRELSKKAVSKGEASSFSERLKGFTWIGYDRNKLTCGEDAIRKAGWINTTTSAGSAEAVMASAPSKLWLLGSSR